MGNAKDERSGIFPKGEGGRVGEMREVFIRLLKLLIGMCVPF